MMMFFRFSILAWALILSGLAFSLPPAAEAQSMDFHSRNTSQQVANDLQSFINDNSRYFEDLKKKQKEAEKAQADGVPDAVAAYLAASGDDMEKLLRGQLVSDRPAAAVAAELAKTSGDGTWVGNYARRAYSIMTFGKYLPPERHNFLLSALLSDYLENPKDRQSIELVISAWDPLVDAEIKASYSDTFTEWVDWGMGLAWVAVVIWDWRDGWKGLSKDGKNLISMAGRGPQFALDAARRLRTMSMDFTGIGSGFTKLGLGEADVAHMAKDPAYLEEQAANAGHELMKELKPNRAGVVKMMKNGLEQAQMHAWQVARAMVLAGVPVWYLETEMRKLPPLVGLQATQGIAVQRLQVKVAELRARMNEYAGKEKGASPEQLRALETDRKALQDAYDALEDEYDDLASSRAARIYQADLPWKDLNSRAQELAKKNWFQTRRLPPDERYVQFAESQQKLGDVLRQVQTEINREKVKQRYSESDSLRYGLTAIVYNLKWIKLGLDKFEAKNEAAATSKGPKKP